MRSKRVLFICSQNRLRRPTAEQLFASHPGIECASAGTNRDADNPLTEEIVEWAEIIFVMEKAHRNKLDKELRRVPINYVDGRSDRFEPPAYFAHLCKQSPVAVPGPMLGSFRWQPM